MKRKRILFAEDMSVFREPISRALEYHDYEVVCTTDGRQALEALRTQELFDLLLADLAMPELDGFGLLRIIRAEQQPWSEIPVILLTAAAEKDFVLEAKELRVKEYLVKAHFSLDYLLAAIARCV